MQERKVNSYILNKSSVAVVSALLVKVTPISLWLKCINLSKCIKLCSTDKLEVADKYFLRSFDKNYLIDWQIWGGGEGA